MNSYEKKIETRRQRLLERAYESERKSLAHYERSKEGLPPGGEPIKVGHHSERKHRAAIAKSHNEVSRSVEESRKAVRYREKAAVVGCGGISSDDPDAVAHLEAKIGKLEQAQAYMLAVNKIVRKHRSDAEQCVAVLQAELEVDEKTARQLLEADFAGRVGFADYLLRNNNAKLRSARQRLRRVQRCRASISSSIIGTGATLVRNVEINRLQIAFDGKPDEVVRSILKRRGFKWSRTEGAWQRQLDTLAPRFVQELISSPELGRYFLGKE